MNRKEKRDAKNAKHKRNERRRLEAKARKMFGPMVQVLHRVKRGMEAVAAVEEAQRRVWESGVGGFR